MPEYVLQEWRGGVWDGVAVRTDVEAAWQELERRGNPGNHRTLMIDGDGEEHPVTLIRGMDDGEPYYWAQCGTDRCIASVHPGDNEHVDYTGNTWKEGE